MGDNVKGLGLLKSRTTTSVRVLPSKYLNKFIRPKQNICLFPICCHFNQLVGRKFILFFILFLVTSTDG